MDHNSNPNRWPGYKPRSATVLRTALGIHFGNSLGPGPASSLQHAVAYSGHERPPVWTRIGRAGHHRHAGHTPVPGGEWTILRDPRSGYGVPGGAHRADADAVPGAVRDSPAQSRSLPVFPLISPFSSKRSRASSRSGKPGFAATASLVHSSLLAKHFVPSRRCGVWSQRTTPAHV